MKKKKIAAVILSVALIIALAASVYAFPAIIKEMNIFQKAARDGVSISAVGEAKDFRHTPINNTKRIDSDISGKAVATEHFSDDKTDIYNRMLNTIDYLDRVSVTARTNMISTSESILSYDVNIDAGISYQSVTENDKLVSETFSSTESGMVAVNSIDRTYSEKNVPVYTRKDTPYINLAERIVDGDDGIPCYYYRRNITNCPLASYCLVPQEITFSYLKDFDTWEIVDNDAEYLGRSCVVINGTPSPYIAAKHKIDSFKMIVDKETGVLLSFEGMLGDELIRYMNVTEISCNDVRTPVRQFDEAQYSEYESLTLKNSED